MIGEERGCFHEGERYPPVGQRGDQTEGEVGDSLETVEIYFLPVVGAAMIIFVEIGEEVEHRPVGRVERRLIARSVAVALRLEIESCIPVQRVEQSRELFGALDSVDDQPSISETAHHVQID